MKSSLFSWAVMFTSQTHLNKGKMLKKKQNKQNRQLTNTPALSNSLTEITTTFQSYI